MRRLHRYPCFRGRSLAISQAFDQVPRIACITIGTVTSCHLLTTNSGIAVIRGMGSSVVRVADERLPSRLRCATVQSWRGNFEEQVKIRPPGSLAVGRWPESAARPMMAIR
jgi:hypothetical protein